MQPNSDAMAVDGRGQAVDDELVCAAIDEAREGRVDVSVVSLNRVARRAGVSRATLFRRIGNRAALEEAVRRRGIDVGTRRTVRERALQAALELVETGGVTSLTLERVAQRAGCSVTSVHQQFDGREGLLATLFEQYSPIVSVERLLHQPRPGGFEEQVRSVYEAFFDIALRRRAMLGALISNVLGQPSGPVSRFAQGTALPHVLAELGAWLAEEAAKGNCRELPVPVSIPLLIGPVVSHLAIRTAIERDRSDLPALEEVIDELTHAFCRAVAP